MVNKGVLTIEFYKSKDRSDGNMIGVLDMKLPPALDLAVSIFSQRSTISFVGYSCPYLLPLPLSGTN